MPRPRKGKKRGEDKRKSKESGSKLEAEDKASDKSVSITTLFRSEDLQGISTVLDVTELDDSHLLLGAVALSRFDIVKRLLHEKFPIDLGLSGTTPLILAVKLKLIEMADFLIRKGADLCHGDGEGNNVLLLAAQHTDWDQESFLDFWNRIKESRVDINHANKVGHTILHCLVKRQWAVAIDNILKHSKTMDVNHVTGKGVTALMMACSRHQEPIIKCLLRSNANIFLEDQKGCTALCYAIAYFIQKKMFIPNHSIAQLTTYLEMESSIFEYLNRRLELLIDPPEESYAVTMTTVIVHIMTFSARCLDSGMEILLRLDIFKRIREAVEKHMDDIVYVLGIMGIVAEIMRHCDCCCTHQMENVITAFHESEIPNICLQIIKRLKTPSADSSHLRTVLLPIILTFDHPRMKCWLRKNMNSIERLHEDFIQGSPPTLSFYPDEAHSQMVEKITADFKVFVNRLQMEELINEVDKPTYSRKQEIGEITDRELPGELCFEGENNSEDCTSLDSKEIGELEGDQTDYAAQKAEIVSDDPSNPGKTRKRGWETVTMGHERRDNSCCSYSGPGGVENETRGFWMVGACQDEAPDKSDVSSDCCAGDSVGEKPQGISKKTQSPRNDSNNLVGEMNPPWESVDIGCGDTRMSSSFDGEIDPDEDYTKTLIELNERFYDYISKYERKWQMEYEEGYPDGLGDVTDYLQLMENLPQIETGYLNMVTQNWDRLVDKLERGLENKQDNCKSAISGLKEYLDRLEEDDDSFGNKSTACDDDHDGNSAKVSSKCETSGLASMGRDTVLDTPLELGTDEWGKPDIQHEVDIPNSLGQKLSSPSPEPNASGETSADVGLKEALDTGPMKRIWCCPYELKPQNVNAEHECYNGLRSEEELNIVCKLCQFDVPTSYCKVTKYTEQLMILNQLNQERLLKGDVNKILILATESDRSNYRLSSIRGVFGPVILALDAFTHQPLVVKSIVKNRAKEEEVVNLCRNVVAPLIKIHSEQLVPYTHYLDIGNNVLLATPLCERNLGEYLMLLKSTAAFSEDLAHMMVNQIVRGLHFLHSQNPVIIHGNLKPSNILADSNGNLRLSEFGLNELRRHTVPTEGLRIWWAQETLKHYESTEEQTEEDGCGKVLLVTTKSDTQTCGMILHYLATGGVHPYGRYPLEIMINLNENRRPTLATKSLYMIDLVAWMLDHDPKQRPTSWQILNHVYVWDRDKQWKFLLTCAGISADRKLTLAVDEFHRNLDQYAKDQKVTIEWVGVIQWGELTPVRDAVDYSDTISGLLALLRDTLPSSANWFLKSFPTMVLTLYRLIEDSPWASHPDFDHFNTID